MGPRISGIGRRSVAFCDAFRRRRRPIARHVLILGIFRFGPSGERAIGPRTFSKAACRDRAKVGIESFSGPAISGTAHSAFPGLPPDASQA